MNHEEEDVRHEGWPVATGFEELPDGTVVAVEFESETPPGESE